MTVSAPHAPRVRRRLGILALQIVVVLAGLALVEAGMRCVLWIGGAPYDAGETLRQAEKLTGVNRDFLPKEVLEQAEAKPDFAVLFSLHPYLGWEFDPSSDQLEGVIRGYHSRRKSGPLKIFVVGGSVAAAFCAAQSNAGGLVECLSSDSDLPERTYSVLNLSRGGYKEPQQIDFVVYMLSLGFEPDVVINIDGFNEVALGNHNESQGYHPVYPSAAHWANLVVQGTSDEVSLGMMGKIRDSQRALAAWADRFEAWHLERSCLIGTLALKRMIALRADIVSRFEAYANYLASLKQMLNTHGPRLEGGEQATINACIRVWKESSRCLNDICREHDIIYLHVLQPTLYDKGSKPVTEREIEHGTMAKTWIRGAELGYPKLREAGEELRRSGVDFIDASMLFKDHPEELYYDGCHFVDAGHVLLAKLICRELARRLKEAR